MTHLHAARFLFLFLLLIFALVAAVFACKKV
jgi:hypothetical protein